VLRTDQGALLDHALTLWFPGPATATGEDLAELHLHDVNHLASLLANRQDFVSRFEPAIFRRGTRLDDFVDDRESVLGSQ